MQVDRCEDCGVSVRVPEGTETPLCPCCRDHSVLRESIHSKPGRTIDDLGLSQGVSVIWYREVSQARLSVLVSCLASVLSSRSSAPDLVRGARDVANALLAREAVQAFEQSRHDLLTRDDRMALIDGLRLVSLPHDMTGWPKTNRLAADPVAPAEPTVTSSESVTPRSMAHDERSAPPVFLTRADEAFFDFLGMMYEVIYPDLVDVVDIRRRMAEAGYTQAETDKASLEFETEGKSAWESERESVRQATGRIQVAKQSDAPEAVDGEGRKDDENK